MRKFLWGSAQEDAFRIPKEELTSALVLTLPDGAEDMVIYSDASQLSPGWVLMQQGKVIEYASK